MIPFITQHNKTSSPTCANGSSHENKPTTHPNHLPNGQTLHENAFRAAKILLQLQRIIEIPTTAAAAMYKQTYIHPSATQVPDHVFHYHNHSVGPNQCCAAVSQHISTPVSTVWSVVRCFDNPQAYKHSIKSCHVILGDGDVGSLREIDFNSLLPALRSTERLEILDDKRQVISFSVVGGNHRLENYRSVTTMHAAEEGGGTLVVESYVVDVPQGNTKEETCVYVDTIVKCNLQSLAYTAEASARRNAST